MIDQFFSAQGWGTAMGPVSPQNPPTNNIPLFGNFQPSFPPPAAAAIPSGSGALHPRHTAGSVAVTAIVSVTSSYVGAMYLYITLFTGHRHTKLNLPNIVHPEPVLFKATNNIHLVNMFRIPYFGIFCYHW